MGRWDAQLADRSHPLQGSGQHLKITLSAPKPGIPEISPRPSGTFFRRRLSTNLAQQLVSTRHLGVTISAP